MPCKYAVSPDGRLIVERWTGDVGQAEVAMQERQLLLDPSIKDGASALSDCTRARFAIAPEPVDALASMDSEPRGTARVRHHAFLVSSDACDRAQRLAAQVERYGKGVVIFSAFDVACTWLGIDELKARELMDGLESGSLDRREAGPRRPDVRRNARPPDLWKSPRAAAPALTPRPRAKRQPA